MLVYLLKGLQGHQSPLMGQEDYLHSRGEEIQELDTRSCTPHFP
jgi:hypothetical protein